MHANIFFPVPLFPAIIGCLPCFRLKMQVDISSKVFLLTKQSFEKFFKISSLFVSYFLKLSYLNRTFSISFFILSIYLAPYIFIIVSVGSSPSNIIWRVAKISLITKHATSSWIISFLDHSIWNDIKSSINFWQSFIFLSTPKALEAPSVIVYNSSLDISGNSIEINLFLKLSGNSCLVPENLPLLGFKVKIKQKSLGTSFLINFPLSS